jgi:hypothetical protein
MKTQKQITLIGLGIIASILMVPIVYAAVEPHIILVMDSAQTTNPFTIQNNAGTDVFVIDENGGDIIVQNTYRLRASGEGVTLVNATDTSTDPIVLAAVKFNTPPATETGLAAYTWIEHRMYAEMLVDSGTWITFQTQRSTDDITWTDEAECTSGGLGTWVRCSDVWENFEADLDIYYRIVVYSGDGISEGAIANYYAEMKMIMPPGYTVDPAWTG